MRAAIFVMASLLVSVSASAQRLGGEIVVSAYSASQSLGPDVATGPWGTFTTAWQSQVPPPPVDVDILGRRYSVLGGAGSVFRIDSSPGGQGSVSLAVDPSGRTVVAWDSDGTNSAPLGVVFRQLSASGAPSGPEVLVTSSGYRPDVAFTAKGSFVVVWVAKADSTNTTEIVRGRRYSPSGTPMGPEFQINTSTIPSVFGFGIEKASVASDAAGNFVVVWHRYYAAVVARRYNRYAVPIGPEFDVDTAASGSGTGRLSSPDVSVAPLGAFVVTWERRDTPGTDDDVFARRYSAAGSAAGAPFRVNTYRTNSQRHPAVAMDTQSGFVVVWESRCPIENPGCPTQDGNLGGIYGQWYWPSGHRRGGEFRVNATTTWDQFRPAVAVRRPARFTPSHFYDAVVVWANERCQATCTYAIVAQRLQRP
jgi:hypothetical protein